MGRGKGWSDLETKVLVQAFLRIMQDPNPTTASGTQMYQKVMDVAKTLYTDGEWVRSIESSRKRWKEISKEVLLFITSMKVIRSVKHRNWDDDDYYEAAVDHYVENHSNKKIKTFKFKDEWKILRNVEVWQVDYSDVEIPAVSYYNDGEDDNAPTQSDDDDDDNDSEDDRQNGATTNTRKRRRRTLEATSGSDDNNVDNNDSSNTDMYNALLEKLKESDKTNQASNQEMLQLMKQNFEQSKANAQLLERVLDETTKLREHIQKTTAIEALIKVDMSSMTETFQKNARQKIAEELGRMLNFDVGEEGK